MWTGSFGPRRMPVLLAFACTLAGADQTVGVGIENYQFVPAEVVIRAGDSVEWINREKRTSHSVLFPDEGGLESERLFPGERWQRRFGQPGRYPYHCGPHPEMKGVVLVE